MEPDYMQLLKELLDASPTPHGWARWCVAVWTARELEIKDQATAKDVLMQLVAVAPRPRSYKRWNAHLAKLEAVLGEAYCVSCCQVHPMSTLAHQESGRETAEVAGLLCPRCLARLKEGKSWPVNWKGLPIIKDELRYQELRRQHDRQSTESQRGR